MWIIVCLPALDRDDAADSVQRRGEESLKSAAR